MLQLNVIGNLGGDAVPNQVNGKQVINFSLAHTETWVDKEGNKQSKSVWVSCNYWTESDRILPYLKKGTQLFVSGIPSTKIYQGQKGEPIAQLVLRVSEIQLLGGKKETNETSY